MDVVTTESDDIQTIVLSLAPAAVLLAVFVAVVRRMQRR
jgi:hypothetical protein